MCYFELSLFKLQSYNSVVGIKILVTEVQIKFIVDNITCDCKNVSIVCDTDGIVKLAEAKRLGSLYLRLLAKQMKRTYCIKVIIEALLSLTCIINWSKYFSWHNVQQWCGLIGVLFLYHYACSVWPMWAHERCELMPWWSDTLIYEKFKCYLKMWMFSAFYTIYCLNQM